jgi:hypothetical protein
MTGSRPSPAQRGQASAPARHTRERATTVNRFDQGMMEHAASAARRACIPCKKISILSASARLQPLAVGTRAGDVETTSPRKSRRPGSRRVPAQGGTASARARHTREQANPVNRFDQGMMEHAASAARRACIPPQKKIRYSARAPDCSHSPSAPARGRGGDVSADRQLPPGPTCRRRCSAPPPWRRRYVSLSRISSACVPTSTTRPASTTTIWSASAAVCTRWVT